MPLFGVRLDVLRHLRGRQDLVGGTLKLGPYLPVDNHDGLRILFPDAHDVVDGHLMVDMASTLPSEDVSHQTLTLALPNQGSDALQVVLRVE